jgi:acyl dehydratase
MIFRPFSASDQADFVKLSLDNNPLHTDAVAARRSMFGEPVVHGIHGVLRALDYWLEHSDSPLQLAALKATFYKPIKVGEALQLEVTHNEDSSIQMRLLNANSVATRITVKWEPVESGVAKELARAQSREIGEARNASIDEIASDSGVVELVLDAELAHALFPSLASRLPAVQFAAILHLSRLVGMRCPGRHSLFSEFQLVKAEGSEIEHMRYAVKSFDRRIGAVVVEVSAPGMQGSVKAFRLPEPKAQASYQELKQRLAENEFSGQNALIIGGSRGLGEVAAKLLAAGGANIKITYVQGKQEADLIVGDIVSNGGVADCFLFDVLNPLIPAAAISASGWKPTHIYYFATPFIFSGSKGKFSADLFRKFSEYYVTGFTNLVDALLEFQPLKVFYPSSVAIDELPKNLGEYAAAKIAGELLCDFLEKCHSGLQIYKSRFPRTETDQTATIMPVASADPADLMLSELRLFERLSAR